MISIIVAVSRNGVIGKKNELIWKLSSDLKHFAQLTTGHPVIMGRKTFDSIYSRIGKPLPNRKNIVLSRQKNLQIPGVTVYDSLQKIIKDLSTTEEAFIIGGEEIYKLALPFSQKMYITHVECDVEGDAFFPEVNKSEWKFIHSEKHSKDEKNEFDYEFRVYERKR